MNSTLASLGPALADHLWQSTAFAVVAWLLTVVLRKNLARVRYAIWLAASIKFLVPFSLLVSAGNLLPHPKQPVAPVVYSAMDVMEEPFAAVAAPLVPSQVRVATLRERAEVVLPECLGVLWLAGLGAVLFGWWNRWRVLSRSLHQATIAHEGRELEILRRLESASILKRHRAVLPLLISAERMEPGIFGVFRPVLVWPQQLSARLDDEQIEAIIAHELTHIRRRDNLTALIHMLVEAAFWFHPLVWWMERQMVKEREQACDEAVVEMGGSAETYAESLLKTCRFCIESPLTCVAGVTGADLRRRVADIVTARALLRMTWLKKLLLVVAAVCVVAAPVVLGQAKAAQRLMLAAMKDAARPIQFAAHAMIAEEETPASEEIAGAAEIQDSTQDVTVQLSKFEAASIRPCPDPRQHLMPGDMYPPRGTSTPGRLRTGCYPLLDDNGMGLIRGAYADTFTPISGGPSWVHSAFYEIDAIAEGNPSVKTMMGPMMQRLLEERFHLKIHHQTGEGPVYLLSVARGGPKLHPFVEGSCVLRSSSPPLALQPGQEYCESLMGAGSPASVKDQGATLDYFSRQLLVVLDCPVINKTGITGRFDIHVEFSREGTKMAGMALTQPIDGTSPASDPMGPPSIFTALQEQLGLKLEPGKGPVDVVVIDHIDRPTVDGAEVTAAASVVPVAMVEEKVGAASASGSAQQTQASADATSASAYDVVSIRQASPDEFQGFVGLRVTPDGLNGLGPLPVLIRLAYGGYMKFPTDDSIVGFPDWAKTRLYSITAKMSGDQLVQFNKLSFADQQKQRELMLQSLLADRLKLKVHLESKQLPDYELVIAKGGSKLDEAPVSGPPPSNGFKGPDGKPVAGSFVRMMGVGKIVAQNYGMAQFAANFLSGQIFGLGRSVVDKTGLTGKYNFSLNWTPDTGAGSASAAQSAEDQGPSVFTALQEQLGLRLQPSTGIFDILVIDHIEPPSEN